jgi:hypothetical protein
MFLRLAFFELETALLGVVSAPDGVKTQPGRDDAATDFEDVWIHETSSSAPLGYGAKGATQAFVVTLGAALPPSP